MLIFGFFHSYLSFGSFKTKCFYTLMHTQLCVCVCVCISSSFLFILNDWLKCDLSLSMFIISAWKSALGRAYFVVGTLYFYSMTEIMIIHILFDALLTLLFYIIFFVLFCLSLTLHPSFSFLVHSKYVKTRWWFVHHIFKYGLGSINGFECQTHLWLNAFLGSNVCVWCKLKIFVLGETEVWNSVRWIKCGNINSKCSLRT